MAVTVGSRGMRDYVTYTRMHRELSRVDDKERVAEKEIKRKKEAFIDPLESINFLTIDINLSNLSTFSRKNV